MSDPHFLSGLEYLASLFKGRFKNRRFFRAEFGRMRVAGQF
jgi:hypothetical protein